MSQDGRTSQLRDEPAAALGPWSSTWVRYYDQASRRRHKMGGYKRLREQQKRKKVAEWIRIGTGAFAVAMLVSVFYFILSR
ncbi:MAG TPA: hypothetical protein VHJ20_16710 [Polyangia bacterium]|nr:hypothetical protein [Polyangia bacterium]